MLAGGHLRGHLLYLCLCVLLVRLCKLPCCVLQLVDTKWLFETVQGAPLPKIQMSLKTANIRRGYGPAPPISLWTCLTQLSLLLFLLLLIPSPNPIHTLFVPPTQVTIQHSSFDFISNTAIGATH